jgi:hypothetical protein
MILAHPAALIWLALAVPLVVCYLLRVRLRQVDVATHLFWNEIFPESRHTALWGRLHHVGSLLVQLLLLALLASTLAEPILPGEALAAHHVVLVLDHSASMSARDGNGTRFDRARAEARRVVAGLNPGDETALVICGADTRVACAPTSYHRALTQALDGVKPDDGPGNIPEAVALARRLLAGVAGGRVLVISDGCCEGAAAVAAAPDVRWLPVGRAENNAGIRQLQARRSLRDPTAYEVLFEVTNPSAEPLACRLFLERDGNPVDVLPLRAEANDVWRYVGEYTSVEGGILTARLEHADALAADDRAFAVLPPRRELPVRLVSPGSLFLEKVLEANPMIRQPVALAPNADEAATADAGESPPVTVCHQKLPARLPAGPVIVIDPRSACDLWELGEVLAEPVVAEQDSDSPLLTQVKLRDLTLPRARQLKPLHDRTEVLAKGLGGEPLCFTVERPEGRVFVLTGDLEAGELPLRTAFPILMSNALVWLAGSKENGRAAVPTGSVVELTLPDRPGLQWFAPDGRALPLPAGATRASVGPLDQVGVWRAAAGSDEPAVAEVACNLANGRRSDLRPDPAVTAAARPEEGQLFRRPTWFFLLCLVAGLLGLEWCLYQRRKIR